ncbi:hypothetical protein [Iodobacter sp.]|uniref:hypothetical protein n=1 Tax=Iodobacter sp. TaxID=1915058 RepID=UPI0025FF9D7A|nr:hypothetical protein [Iodobacter sp.]
MKKTGYKITAKGVEKNQIALRMYKHEVDVLKYMAEKECMGWGALARVYVLAGMKAMGVHVEEPSKQ